MIVCPSSADCDAMFIDNPSASLLTDIPREHRLPFQCRVFSRRSGDEFLAFLRGIRDATTSEHRDLVRTLYGRDWDKPNLRLFEK